MKLSHILVSYPLSPRSLLTAFRGTHYTETLSQLLRNPRSNVLVVYSDQDEFTAVGKYDAWAESLRNVPESRGELAIVRINDVNHFWSNPAGRQELLEVVGGWVP